jgi:hypothetical protein
MRKAGREIWEVSKIWWLVVPGGALGVVAIVQVVRGTHGKSVWFWGFWALMALLFAVVWRLRSVLKERDAARAALAEEGTRDAVANRLDRFAHEYELLGAEAPGEQEGVGPVNTPEQASWSWSSTHLNEQISSELRQHAPGFVTYWRTNPREPPPRHPFDVYVKDFVSMSVEQLRHIATRLREGHDAP